MKDRAQDAARKGRAECRMLQGKEEPRAVDLCQEQQHSLLDGFDIAATDDYSGDKDDFPPASFSHWLRPEWHSTWAKLLVAAPAVQGPSERHR